MYLIETDSKAKEGGQFVVGLILAISLIHWWWTGNALGLANGLQSAASSESAVSSIFTVLWATVFPLVVSVLCWFGAFWIMIVTGVYQIVQVFVKQLYVWLINKWSGNAPDKDALQVINEMFKEIYERLDKLDPPPVPVTLEEQVQKLQAEIAALQAKKTPLAVPKAVE